MTRRRTASIVCSIWLAVLATGAPALGDPGRGDNRANAASELQEEYPLHEPRQCCSRNPTSAVNAAEPAALADGGGTGDGGDGLPAAVLILLALLAGLGLWLVARLVRRTARPTGTAAAAAAGHANPAIDRLTDVPRPRPRPQRVASPPVTPESTKLEPPAPERDDFVTEVLNAALEHLRDRSWVWAEGAEEAVEGAAAGLSDSPEEQSLVLDAIALGYWIRYVERDFTHVNIADPAWVTDLRSRYRGRGSAEISAAMDLIARDMPGAFRRGPTIWAAVQAGAGSILEQRASRLIAWNDDAEAIAAISRETRESALALGYGLCVTVESLGVDGVRAVAAR
jgi:hypothetical protein